MKIALFIVLFVLVFLRCGGDEISLFDSSGSSKSEKYGWVEDVTVQESRLASMTMEDWVGTYHSGSGLDYGATIELLSDGSYWAGVDSCYGPWGTAKGTWTEFENEVRFHQESIDGDFIVNLVRARKVVLDDGVLLVPAQWMEKLEKYGPNCSSCFRKDSAYINWGGPSETE